MGEFACCAVRNARRALTSEGETAHSLKRCIKRTAAYPRIGLDCMASRRPANGDRPFMVERALLIQTAAPQRAVDVTAAGDTAGLYMLLR